jgi:hypothetical protein
MCAHFHGEKKTHARARAHTHTHTHTHKHTVHTTTATCRSCALFGSRARSKKNKKHESVLLLDQRPGQKISIVSRVVTLYSKCARALTFQAF